METRVWTIVGQIYGLSYTNMIMVYKSPQNPILY